MPTSPTSGPGGGSGGSSVGPSCALSVNAGIDIHASGQHYSDWDTLVNNVVDFTPLVAIPTGLGLSFTFNGTGHAMATTAAGVWAFTTTIGFPSADATIRGRYENQLYGSGVMFGPTLTTSPEATLTEVFALPSGASFDYVFSIATDATANPYTAVPILAITRLA